MTFFFCCPLHLSYSFANLPFWFVIMKYSHFYHCFFQSALDKAFKIFVRIHSFDGLGVSLKVAFLWRNQNFIVWWDVFFFGSHQIAHQCKYLRWKQAGSDRSNRFVECIVILPILIFFNPHSVWKESWGLFWGWWTHCLNNIWILYYFWICAGRS